MQVILDTISSLVDFAVDMISLTMDFIFARGDFSSYVQPNGQSISFDYSALPLFIILISFAIFVCVYLFHKIKRGLN